MAHLIDFFRRYLAEFKRHFLRYLALFLGTSLFLELVLIPLFTWFARLIQLASGIPYISYNNLQELISHHFLGVLGLFALLGMMMLVVYLQFVLQIQGVRLIQEGTISRHAVIKSLRTALARLSWRSFSFFLVYFLLILPFGKYAFSTPLLDKVKIPAFTMEFFYHGWHILILSAFYLFVFVIGARFLFVLPLTILKKKRVRVAIRESVTITRGFRKLTHLGFYMAAIAAFVFVLSQAFYWTLYALQTQFDKTNFALFAAISCMTLIYLMEFLVQTLAQVLLFSFILRELGFAPSDKKAAPSKTNKLFKIATVSVSLLFMGLIILSNYVVLSGFLDKPPVTISHRGVDDENGVQNTIPALELTAKEKPDYVEMDIQETADRQFIVLHDTNTLALTGTAKIPQKTSLQALTELTAHENGKSAKLVSFDVYLSAAEKLHQKLLVEIKTSRYDSSDLTDRFIQKYAARLLKNGDKIHSLDYNIVKQMKEKKPELFVSFILPYDLISPNTVADAYTIEATTLSFDFVDSTSRRNQLVFAWTVNDPLTMRRMMSLQVDGIITDNLGELKRVIKADTNHPSYADRIRLAIEIDTGIGVSAEN